MRGSAGVEDGHASCHWQGRAVRLADASCVAGLSRWASLPTALSLSFTTPADESTLLVADLSRVQHSHSNVNTAFRILVDSTVVVAFGNTGDAYGGGAFSCLYHPCETARS